MSDYTPTTHYLRDIYCNHVQGVIERGFNDDLMHKDAHAEFDRWLTKVKAEAWQEGMISVKKHVSCWPKQEKLPVNPYILEIGKTTQDIPETGNNV